MANPVTLPDQTIGGASYEAGDGIAIQNDTISVKVDGSSVTFNASGELQASGGSGTEYSAGDGIDITEGEISAKLADGSGLRFDDGGLQIVHQLATPGAEDEGKVLTVTNGLGAYAWADPQGGGSSTVATTGCIAGDGSSNNKIKLLYDGSLDLTSPEYTLTINSSATYGTCGTLTAYSSEVIAVLPAPCSFYFQGFQWPGMSQTCTASCYLYCPSTQALIRSESTTIHASGTPTRANITLDVNNPAEGSTGVFNEYSYEYDWEVYLVINGSETSFTNADLISHAKLSVTNPLPSSLGTAGQVLTVNAGATGVEWGSPSGGAVYVELDTNMSSAEAQTAFNVIRDAYLAGKQVIAYHTTSGVVDATHFYTLSYFESSDAMSTHKAIFTAVDGGAPSSAAAFKMTRYAIGNLSAYNVYSVTYANSDGGTTQP